MRHWLEFWIRHLYIVLMLVSTLVINCYGGYRIYSQQRGYDFDETLVSVAVHDIRSTLSHEEEEAYMPISTTETTEFERSEIDAEQEAEEYVEDVVIPAEDSGSVTDEVVEESITEEDHNDDLEDEKVQGQPWLNPDWQLADDAYFDDALFIGDSRTVGFGMYSQLDNITVFADVGFQIYTAATKPVIDFPDGKVTLADALALRSGDFKKVYIMFGLNEMGWGTEEQLDTYFYNLIDYIKETQPGAVIYLQSIIHVSKAKSEESPVFANDAINVRNDRLKQIAENEHIYYLDLNEIFTDENGDLFADAASDGVHLKVDYVLLWKEFLKAHAIYN